MNRLLILRNFSCRASPQRVRVRGTAPAPPLPPRLLSARLPPLPPAALRLQSAARLSAQGGERWKPLASASSLQVKILSSFVTIRLLMTLIRCMQSHLCNFIYVICIYVFMFKYVIMYEYVITFRAKSVVLAYYGQSINKITSTPTEFALRITYCEKKYE